MQVKPWWVRAHRWAALTIGLLLLVEVASGMLVLFESEVNRALHPQWFQVTASDKPISVVESMAVVTSADPGFRPSYVSLSDGVYQVRDTVNGWNERVAYVDSGTGRINAVGTEGPWFMELMVNLHDCALSCEDYPGYQPWLAKPMPGAPGEVTIAGFLLGTIGALTVLVVLSGLVIWWPPIHRFASGFVLRRNRGTYVRDLDLHKLVGIVVLPVLLMWAYTGASFYFEWPERAYYALLPGSERVDETPTPGTGPPISMPDAITAAAALYPDGRVVGIYSKGAAEPGGVHFVYLDTDAFDPYRYSDYSRDAYVSVDGHGGGVVDHRPGEGPLTQQWWRDGIWYGIHFGSIVAWPARLVWLTFGLAPFVLAVTGLTIWRNRRRIGRNRRERRRRAATPG